jgi:shikimate kinase
VTPVIFLIGPRGSGKTTVAALVAERLGWAWIDADCVLEQRAGKSIHEIFAAEGEACFRLREREILGELCGLERTVIATGGGAVLHPENRERMRSTGTVIWLTADAHTLHQRTTTDAQSAHRRPALGPGGIAEVLTILEAREPLYRECAHFIVDTSGRSPAEVAMEVQGLLASRQGGDT